MAKELVDTDGNVVEHGFEALLKTSEVAQIMRVDPRTVTNWAIAGKLRHQRTIGGHRRYPESAVRAAVAGDWEKAAHGEPETDLLFVAE